MSNKELKAYPNIGLFSYLTTSNFSRVSGQWVDILKNLNLSVTEGNTLIKDDISYNKLFRLPPNVKITGDIPAGKLSAKTGFTLSIPIKVNNIFNINQSANILDIGTGDGSSPLNSILGLKVMAKEYSPTGSICFKLSYTDTAITSSTLVQPTLNNKELIIAKEGLSVNKPISIIFKVFDNKTYLYIDGELVKPGATGVNIINNNSNSMAADGGCNVLFQKDNINKLTIGKIGSGNSPINPDLSIGELLIYSVTLEDDVIESMAYTSTANLDKVGGDNVNYSINKVASGYEVGNLVEMFVPYNMSGYSSSLRGYEYTTDRYKDDVYTVKVTRDTLSVNNVTSESVNSSFLDIVNKEIQTTRTSGFYRDYIQMKYRLTSETAITDVKQFKDKVILIPIADLITGGRYGGFVVSGRFRLPIDYCRYTPIVDVPLFSILTSGLNRVAGAGFRNNTSSDNIEQLILYGDDTSSSNPDSDGLPRPDVTKNKRTSAIEIPKDKDIGFTLQVEPSLIYLSTEYGSIAYRTPSANYKAAAYLALGICPGMPSSYLYQFMDIAVYNDLISFDAIKRNNTICGCTEKEIFSTLYKMQSDVFKLREDVDRILKDGGGTPIRVIDANAPTDTIPNGTIVLRRFK